jgi:hypothetical protein
MRRTAKLKPSTAGAGTWASRTRALENRSNPPVKGDAFVSDTLHGDETFFARYRAGRASAAQLDDCVEAWHESGDAEQRSLAEFLGVTDEEYAVLFITPRALPAILDARCSGRTSRECVKPLFERLRDAGDPGDAPVLHALGYWLRRPGGD